jgi:hypothetical protein
VENRKWNLLGLAMLLGAMAGGLGWGIRGSTDTKRHDRRDVSGLTMVFLFASHLDTPTLARAVAWSTVAIGFGKLINRGLICQPGIFHCRTVSQG